jgi:hypothetical protein
MQDRRPVKCEELGFLLFPIFLLPYAAIFPSIVKKKNYPDNNEKNNHCCCNKNIGHFHLRQIKSHELQKSNSRLRDLNRLSLESSKDSLQENHPEEEDLKNLNPFPMHPCHLPGFQSTLTRWEKVRLTLISFSRFSAPSRLCGNTPAIDLLARFKNTSAMTLTILGIVEVFALCSDSAPITSALHGNTPLLNPYSVQPTSSHTQPPLTRLLSVT